MGKAILTPGYEWEWIILGCFTVFRLPTIHKSPFLLSAGAHICIWKVCPPSPWRRARQSEEDDIWSTWIRRTFLFRFDQHFIRELGPLFTKRQDVLPQDLVKPWSREIKCYNDRIALKFDRYLGSSAVKFQSDLKNLNPNPVASRLHEILW